MEKYEVGSMSGNIQHNISFYESFKGDDDIYRSRKARSFVPGQSACSGKALPETTGTSSQNVRGLSL